MRYTHTASSGVQQAAEPVPGTLPGYIPWKHGTGKEKKFLCDVMAEGLARQMRLFGIDTASMKQLPRRKRPKNIRYDPSFQYSVREHLSLMCIYVPKSFVATKAGCEKCGQHRS